MKPGTYMVFGGLTGMALSLICAVLPATAPTTVVCIFAAGALFGKGYGVWEERSRKAPDIYSHMTREEREAYESTKA